MRALIALGALIVVVPTCAQTDGTTKSSAWSAALQVSVERSYRHLSSEESGLAASIEFRNRIEVPLLGGTVRGLLGYQFAPHWEVAFGLGLKWSGYQTKALPLTTFESPEGGGGSATTTINYRSVQLPVQMSYTLGDRQMRGLASLGIAPSILLTAEQVLKGTLTNGTLLNSTIDLADQQEFTLDGFVRLGIEYRLGSRFAVQVLGTGSYGLSPIVEAPIQSRLWSVGGVFGLDYHL